MTGVSPFLFLFTIITIKDATIIMPQSFTHMDAGTQTISLPKPKSKRKDVPTYPEPEGDPSY